MAKKNVKYVISLEDKFAGTMNRIDKRTDRFDKKITSLGTKLTAVFGAAIGVRAVKDFGNEIIKTTAKIEGFENAIAFLSGDVQKGAKSMEFLEQNAEKLGISFEASVEGFQTLAGGFRGTKTPMEEVKRIFKDVSIAASAMNLSSERTKLVLLALGQMASKGVVSMEELRRQLGDSLPGAAAIGARSMGLTTQEFNKLVESGSLLSSEFLPKFATEVRKTFEKGLPRSTKSLRASINRLDNSFLLLKTNLGKKFNPQIKKTTGFLNKVVRTASEWAKVPVAETLEDQRNELNRLVIEINDSNKSESQRLAILDRIKEISPDIAKGIKKEGDNYKVSTEALNKFNLEQLNRIVLADKQEKLDKLRRKEEEYGAKAVKQATLIRERQAGAIFKLSKVNKKDAELVQAMLDGTITKETDLAEIREKYGEENMLLLNQSGLTTSRNQQDFINAQNIAIRLIAQRNGLSAKSLGLDKDFYDAVRRFNPLFNAQNAASLKANQLLKERARLAGAFGITSVAPSPELLDSVTTLKSAAPKTFNININSLIEEFNINNIENIQEGAVEMKNIVSRELEKALADLQAIAR